MARKSNKPNGNSGDIPPLFATTSVGATASGPLKESKLVTVNELMKKVAVATGDVGKMKKVFTPEQIKEIMLKRQAGMKVPDEEGMAQVA